MGTGRAARLFVVTSLLAASVAGTARAAGHQPDKMECIAADTEGQSLRLSGKLLKARRRFGVCAAASCPTVVRDDCLQRIGELEAVLPTVVFTATNGYGRPLVAVRVTVDGERLTDRLDGRPLRVDPGEHAFAFEALGRLAARMQLTLSEGDTNVRHAVVLHTESGDPVDEVPAPEVPASGAVGDTAPVPVVAPVVGPSLSSGGAPAASQEPRAPEATSASEATGSGRRTAAIVAGGVGVAGVVVGTILGALTWSHWDAAQRACPSGGPASGKCTQDESRQKEDAVLREGNVATVAFVAGGIGIAAGAWLWFAAPEPSRSVAAVSLVPTASPSEAQLLVRGRF
jgi:hypothetical protein